MESGGGGGASPQVESTTDGTTVAYPEHMTEAHTRWLDDIGWSGNANTNIIRTTIQRNPYKDRQAFDPSKDMRRAFGYAGIFEDYSEDFVPVDLFTKFLSTAKQLATDNREPLTNAKESFEADASSRWAKAEANYKAGMADINAVQTSTFVIGLALLEREKQQEIARFEASAELQQMQMDDQKIMQAIQMMMGAENLKAELVAKASEMMVELIRMRIVAEVDKEAKQLDIDTKYFSFPLAVYQHGANVLASMSGGTQTTSNREYTYGSGLSGNRTMSSISGGLALAGAGFSTAGAGMQLWNQFGKAAGGGDSD